MRPRSPGASHAAAPEWHGSLSWAGGRAVLRASAGLCMLVSRVCNAAWQSLRRCIRGRTGGGSFHKRSPEGATLVQVSEACGVLDRNFASKSPGQEHMRVSKNQGPSYRPQDGRDLIIKSPTKRAPQLIETPISTMSGSYTHQDPTPDQREATSGLCVRPFVGTYQD